MDRRDFFKAGSAAFAGIALASCKGTTSSSRIRSEDGVMASHSDGVSLLGYGCMRWPMTKDEAGQDVIDQAKVNQLVDYALGHGVNYFDTAPVYHGGKSERATAIALLRHPRESYRIATKMSNYHEFSFEFALRMYQDSLRNFETDYIDYYLLHFLDGYAAFERRFLQNGVYDFLLEEKKKGHIKHLGFSFHGRREGFDELMALYDSGKCHWDFVQIQMNYRDWRHSGREASAEYMYNELLSRGIPVVVMEPLLGGRLADIPAPLADMLKQREPSRTIASWAFRFCGTFPGVLTVLSGMTYQEHLQDNVYSYTGFKPLVDEELDLLELISDKIDRYHLVDCTACEYCMPCPYGIDIPGIFRFYNDNITAGTYVATLEQENYARIRRRYLLSYDKSVASVSQADHCIGCRKCVELCPQHLDIPHQLQRIDRYIESLRQETI